MRLCFVMFVFASVRWHQSIRRADPEGTYMRLDDYSRLSKADHFELSFRQCTQTVVAQLVETSAMGP